MKAHNKACQSFQNQPWLYLEECVRENVVIVCVAVAEWWSHATGG